MVREALSLESYSLESILIWTAGICADKSHNTKAPIFTAGVKQAIQCGGIKV